MCVINKTKVNDIVCMREVDKARQKLLGYNDLKLPTVAVVTEALDNEHCK